MATDPRVTHHTTPPAPGSLAWAHKQNVGEFEASRRALAQEAIKESESDPRLNLIHNLLQVETDLAEVQRDREDVKTTLRRMEETIDKLQNSAGQIRDQLAAHLGLKDDPGTRVPNPNHVPAPIYPTGRSL